MARIEVISGPERRRRWTEEQKRAIVAESLAPGVMVAEVARRAEVCPAQIYRWRQELRRATNGFAPVLIAPAGADAASDGIAACAAEPTIEVEFADTARVRIPGSVSAELAAAVMKALAQR